MCAISADKYQWLAPGFRLLLTGSHCLSGFTQMETILSQHSHKNQSGALLVSFFFFLLLLPSPLFSLLLASSLLWRDSGGPFLFLLVWRQHLYLFAGPFFSRFLRAPPFSPNHHRRRLHISQRSVSSHRRERAALNAPVRGRHQYAGPLFFCFFTFFLFPPETAVTWKHQFPAVVTASYGSLGLGYERTLRRSLRTPGWLS